MSSASSVPPSVDETLPSSSGWSDPATPRSSLGLSLGTLQPGSVLGNRYEILKLLGEGGMGAVYKARDRAVDRLVAIKIIRPDLASRADILSRFKQEVILARQVTHKNVIRIFDLGEADGLQFITMDFIEGHDLKSMLREKGNFSHDEAIKIVTQICRALDAAHSEGVVHRDLKPQNIMVDAKGRVTVMDFGIARSMEMPGMTQTGSLVGTPEYMSPEQAKGEEVDARSDLFTLGIIFYELLTGKTPFYADTAYATLLKRTQERARDPVELDPTIPPQISAVVLRCLETNRDQRYPSALDIIHDLGQQTMTGSRTALPAIAPASTSAVTVPTPPAVSTFQRYRLWIGVGAAMLLLAIAGVVFRGRIFSGGNKPNAIGPTVSLLILPFQNASGDTSIDWMGKSLAEMLGTDVGQSKNFRTVPPDRLHQILQDLRISSNSDLDPGTITRIAEFTNADHVVFGHYAKYGDQIRIDGNLQDLKAQRTTPISAQAANEQGFPGAVDDLAKSIQQNLALPAKIVQEMKAAAFTPSSKSVNALRDYTQGLELARQGNDLDALKQFQDATAEDGSFALAYSRLALTYLALGHDKDAEQASQKAVGLSEKLPAPEKYRIEAANARIANDLTGAIQAYEGLLKIAPDDSEVEHNLADAYKAAGQYDKARAVYSRLLKQDPKYIDALVGMSGVEIMSGNPQGGLDYLNRAFSLAVELGSDGERATILYDMGVAYKLLNKLDDALRNYQASLEIKQRLGDKRAVGLTLNTIGQVQDLKGDSDAASKSYEAALSVRREIGDTRGIGDTLIDLGNFHEARGHYDQALALYKESLQIQHETGEVAYEALCLNNIGWVYLDKSDYDDATTYFQQALDLRQKLNVPADVADTLYNLGDTLTKQGKYDQALGRFLRAAELWRGASDKRGMAYASYGMGVLFEDQGRYGAALSSMQDAVKSFRDLQDRSFWMAEVLGGYGNALAQVGKEDDAQKPLDEAVGLARQLKNTTLTAKLLDYQGDRLFYKGDFRSAMPLYEQASHLAGQSPDLQLKLMIRSDLARMALQEGRSAAALTSLKGLIKEADSAGLRYLATEDTILFGEALIRSRSTSQGLEQLQNGLQQANQLGARTLQAEAHYQLGIALRSVGKNGDAARELQAARTIAQDIRKEAGADEITKRTDLMPIYAASQ